jgi:hypothetical protein
MTELYVEDPQHRVPFKKTAALELVDEETEEDVTVKQTVNRRCAEVKKIMEEALGHEDETKVVVTWWQPSSLQESGEDTVPAYGELDEAAKSRMRDEVTVEISSRQKMHPSEPEELTYPRPPLRRERLERMLSPRMGHDMWLSDKRSQSVVLQDVYIPTKENTFDTVGRYRYGRRRRVKSELGTMLMETAPTAEERLAGFVRQDVAEPPPPFGYLHPGETMPSPSAPRTRKKMKTKSDVTGIFGATREKLSRTKIISDIGGMKDETGDEKHGPPASGPF